MLNMKNLLTKIINRFGSDMTYVTASNGITGGLRLWKDKSSGTIRGYGYYRRPTDINMDTTIFSIPSGYRPSGDTEIPMFMYTSGGLCAAYYGKITAGGVLTQRLGGTIREGFTTFEYQIFED